MKEKIDNECGFFIKLEDKVFDKFETYDGIITVYRGENGNIVLVEIKDEDGEEVSIKVSEERATKKESHKGIALIYKDKNDKVIIIDVEYFDIKKCFE